MPAQKLSPGRVISGTGPNGWEGAVFTTLGLLDAAGNVIMLALCVAGWRRAAA